MPGWLDAVDVETFMGVGVDGDALALAVAAVEPYIERARADQFPPVIDGQVSLRPSGDVYWAGCMLASRVYGRRNSAGGIAAFNDLGGPVYVARFDPDIERALRVGRYATPRVG